MQEIKHERLLSKTEVILLIYDNLIKGGIIDKKAYINKANVSSKTISRYLNDINSYLEKQYDFLEAGLQIEYCPKAKGYRLRNHEKMYLSHKDIMAITKVLLGTRSFTEEETKDITDKLISNCHLSEQGILKELLHSELSRYDTVEPYHGDNQIRKKLWDICLAVKGQRKMIIKYTRVGENGELEPHPVTRKIIPLGTIFSEYYFYLLAYIEKKDGKYMENPVPYRLDRIKDYEILDEGYPINYKNKFEAGRFRETSNFMQGGEKRRIRFFFNGTSLESILDRFPTAKIIENKNPGYIIEAYGTFEGVKMWLLSQGDAIEVIEPPEFKEEMYNTLSAMVSKYSS
ncbi:MAG: helix-turn-helix transcriptional regulator [Desulfitobacteriia bacterium]